MNQDSNTTIEKKKPRRRWFRFRLRTMLILVTLLTVPIGWVGWELEQRRKENVAVKWVEELGGEFPTWDSYFTSKRSWWEKKKDTWFGERVRVVILTNTQVTNLSPLAELGKLKGLSLNNTQVTNLSPLAGLKNLEFLGLNKTQVIDLSPLAGLKKLEFLFLSDTQVTDLSPLAELTNLESLILVDTQVSDLTPLAGLKNLECLILNKTQVSDLSPLAGLKNLEDLEFSDTQVSDLTPLAGLKKIDFLDLRNTLISEEQVQEIRKARPYCAIDFMPAKVGSDNSAELKK